MSQRVAEHGAGEGTGKASVSEVSIRCWPDRRHAADWSLGFSVGLFGEQR